MPDDPNLRQRRSRLHRSGDHSMCRVDRCETLKARLVSRWIRDLAANTARLEMLLAASASPDEEAEDGA